MKISKTHHMTKKGMIKKNPVYRLSIHKFKTDTGKMRYGIYLHGKLIWAETLKKNIDKKFNELKSQNNVFLGIGPS